MLRRVPALAVIGACAFLLAACGGGNGSGEPSVEGSKPVDSYVVLGGHIKTCWFNPDSGMLRNYVYRAEVAPDGSKVQITVHEPEPLGRPGATIYIIDFHQSGLRTEVTPTNLSMPAELASRMQSDIFRWKRGEEDCGPQVASAAPPKVAKRK